MRSLGRPLRLDETPFSHPTSHIREGTGSIFPSTLSAPRYLFPIRSTLPFCLFSSELSTNDHRLSTVLSPVPCIHDHPHQFLIFLNIVNARKLDAAAACKGSHLLDDKVNVGVGEEETIAEFYLLDTVIG